MPTEPEAGAPDIDGLVQQLKVRVAERRRAGEYPEGLERDLDEHFQRLARRGALKGDVQRMLEAIREASEMDRRRIETVSSKPLGTQMHEVIGRMVARQTEGIFRQVMQFADATIALLEVVIESQPEHGVVLPDLQARVDVALDRLAALERGTAAAGLDDAGLALRVERLEAVVSARQTTPSPTLAGAGDDERLGALAARFNEGPVADVDARDGALLRRLGERGLAAMGAHPDLQAADELRSAGLQVTPADPVAFLDSMHDASLGGIAADLLPLSVRLGTLREFAALARRKLKPAGMLVLSSANPASLEVIATGAMDAAWPAALVCEELRLGGFGRVEVAWLGVPSSGERLEKVDGAAADAYNRNIERLNERLFAPVAYLLTASP